MGKALAVRQGDLVRPRNVLPVDLRVWVREKNVSSGCDFSTGGQCSILTAMKEQAIERLGSPDRKLGHREGPGW